MQTDELRAELTDLANEVEPFEGDLAAVRRRVARRRRAGTSIAAVLVLVLVVAGAAIAATRSDPHKINIAGSVKEARPADLEHVDAAVVMPTGATGADVARVRKALDEASAVVRYAEPPPGSLGLALLVNPKLLLTNACAAPPVRGFAVELGRAPGALHQLKDAVGNRALVRETGGRHDGFDLELFMQVHASDAQTAAVNALLKRDPDVVKIRFLDHQDAYAEFKKLFADQPVLIENQKPDGLPESFRVQLRDGVSRASFAKRYRRRPGVDTVPVSSNPFADPIFGTDTRHCPPRP
jgi:hypothetical protein